jgi:hypothetical protein
MRIAAKQVIGGERFFCVMSSMGNSRFRGKLVTRYQFFFPAEKIAPLN